MQVNAIAESNGDRGKKKKKVSMSSVESKLDRRKKNGEERVKGGWKEILHDKDTRDQENYCKTLIYMRSVKLQESGMINHR